MGNRKKPNLTTETRRHGEDQKIQIMIFADFGIVGNSQSIGVSS